MVESEDKLGVIQGEITNNIKDAEMTLRNINLGIKSEKSSYSSHPEEVVLAKCDILMHWITFYNIEVDTQKILNFSQQLLKNPILFQISNDLRATVHFIVGIAKFISEKTPYSEIKNHLKSALIEADSKPLKSLISHNLAALNYCEIIDFNDRISQSDFLNSE